MAFPNMSNDSDIDIQHKIPISDAGLFAITICGIASMFGNGLVLWSVYKHPSLLNHSSVFITSLAKSDFANGCLCLAFIAFRILSDYFRYLELCLLILCLCFFIWMTSVFTLVLIAAERMTAITAPYRYQDIWTHRRRVAAVLVVWILAFLCSFGPAVDIFLARRNKAYTCDAKHTLTKTFVAVTFTATFVLPFLFLTVMYGSMFRVAWRHRRAIAAQSDVIAPNPQIEIIEMDQPVPPPTPSRNINTDEENTVSQSQSPKRNFAKDFKGALTILIILGIFVISWLPFFCAILLQSFLPGVAIAELNLLSWVFMMGHSAVNPWIYPYRQVDFRRAMQDVLKRRN